MVPEISYLKIETFYHVAASRSFKKAAADLYVTEGAVSQHIRNLEHQLGEKLLERSSRKTILTPDGANLFELIAPIVEKMEGLRFELHETSLKLKGKVRIASFGAMLLHTFPKYIKKFRNKYPDCDILLFQVSGRQTHSMVLSGEVDFGIGSVDVLPNGILGKQLWGCERCLIAPLNHPLSKKKRLTIENIAEHPMVFPDDKDRTAGQKIIALLRASNPNLKVCVQALTWEVVIKYVELGFGVAIVPMIVLQPGDKRRLYVKSISKSDERIGVSRYGILLKEGRYISLAAREFIRFLSPDFNFKSLK